MSFWVLPPEINAGSLFAGAGSAPMLEAATAWDGLAAELAAAAQSFGSVTSGLAGGAWQGPSSAAMAAAATPYARWLATVAGQAEQAATHGRAVAAEFESALAAMVRPAVVASNRSDLVSLVVSNIFGQNAPAIAAVEAEYEQLWAQAVSVTSSYHIGASALVSALTPFSQLVKATPNAAAITGGVGVAAQSLTIPSMTLPGLTIPSLTLFPSLTSPPNIHVGPFSLSSISIPSVTIPATTTPGNVVVGGFGLPPLTIPSVTIPATTTPGNVVVVSV